MLDYKRLAVAKIYTEGDKDAIKKQDAKYLVKRNIFFLTNGRYGFIYILSNNWVVLLDLVVEFSQKNKIYSLVVYVKELIRIFLNRFFLRSLNIIQFLCSQMFICFIHNNNKMVKHTLKIL